MQAVELLEELHRQGATLTSRAEGQLVVKPTTRLTEELRALIRWHKPLLLAEITQRCQPYLHPCGALIIPFDADPKYHWWAGGQSVRYTLRELDAQPEILMRYVEPATNPCSEVCTNTGVLLGRGGLGNRHSRRR